MSQDPTVMRALCDLDCCDCGLQIHAGDDTVLGVFGWVHPLCGMLEIAVDR